jgi:hypothetical protein
MDKVESEEKFIIVETIIVATCYLALVLVFAVIKPEVKIKTIGQTLFAFVLQTVFLTIISVNFSKEGSVIVSGYLLMVFASWILMTSYLYVKQNIKEFKMRLMVYQATVLWTFLVISALFWIPDSSINVPEKWNVSEVCQLIRHRMILTMAIFYMNFNLMMQPGEDDIPERGMLNILVKTASYIIICTLMFISTLILAFYWRSEPDSIS